MRHLSITQPDDWHVHFRDGSLLKDTVAATSAHFGRALVMPNLQPPLTTPEALEAYRQRILACLPAASSFRPYLTFFLNDTVQPEVFDTLPDDVLGAKLYPAGSTTNSEHGAKSLTALFPLFEQMQAKNLVLQVHGEATQGDVFEREARFLETSLVTLMHQFPKLRIVLEHISTRAAVEAVLAAPDTVAATITPHHLMYHRNHLLEGGIKPHYYCLPLLKHEQDQLALRQAATRGNPKFFAGTDSAPHARSQKESACGCAGIYSAPYAVAFYAEVFEELDALSSLNAFLGHFGADFYQLPRNTQTLNLIKQNNPIPCELPLGHDQVIPMGAGTTLSWSVHDNL